MRAFILWSVVWIAAAALAEGLRPRASAAFNVFAPWAVRVAWLLGLFWLGRGLDPQAVALPALAWAGSLLLTAYAAATLGQRAWRSRDAQPLLRAGLWLVPGLLVIQGLGALLG